MSQLKSHPLCLAFPDLADKEYQELLVDIRDNGQLAPIVIYKGQILDGKNRYRACQELGIDPIFQDYEGKDPASYVIALNISRRHLTASQRAMAADRISEWSKQGGHEDIPTIEEASEQLSVAPRSTKTARKIRQEAPVEVLQAVQDSEVTISDAGKVARVSHKVQRQALEDVRSGKTKTLAESVRKQIKGDRPKGSTINLSSFENADADRIRNEVAKYKRPTIAMSHLLAREQEEVWDLVVEIATEKNVDITNTAPKGRIVNGEDKRLARLLIDLVLERYPHQEKKSPNHNDLKAISKLRDTYSPEQIEFVIRWATDHEDPKFAWSEQIRSVAKLSQHFETLLVAIKRQSKRRVKVI